MNSTHGNILVGVVGGSGAGKSWLVERLCRALGAHACRLALDDFYLDRSHLPFTRRAQLNYDVPQAIAWGDAVRVLRDCRAGAMTRVPSYDFATYSRGEPRPWFPRPVIFVEGLWLLRPPELRSLFDLKIYLDTPLPLRERRRVARDTTERGYSEASVLERLATVRPMHERYVEPQRRWADFVLTQPFEAPAIEALSARLWELLAGNGVLPCWMRSTFQEELLSLLVEHEYCH